MNKNVILLIEDEEKLSRTLAEYLELNGYRVLRALNGLEGLSMFYDHMHEVDLILLDIMLPGMDGSEILKEIRKKIQYTGDHGDSKGLDPRSASELYKRGG